MPAQGQPDLSLDNTGDEQAQYREHREGRDPFGLLQPHGADRCWILDPAQAGFHGGVVLLIDPENVSIRTRLSVHGRGEDGPPIVLFRVAQGFSLDCQARARLRRWWICLRGTSAPSTTRAAGVCHNAIVYGMIPPGLGPAASAAMPSVVILRDGRCGISRTGQTA